MAIVVPDVGEKRLLKFLRDRLVQLPGTLHLFQSDVVPDADTIKDDLAEATFSGYAAIPLVAWGEVYLTEDGKAEIREQLRTFAHSGGPVGHDVYGYFVLDDAGFLLWAERDPDGPRFMNIAGHTYPILPRLTLRSE